MKSKMPRVRSQASESHQDQHAEHRLRRDQRRARQRVENVQRAKKMHAERISNRHVRATDSEADVASQLGVHIGCSGWYYWHWKDVFYPAGTPSSQWFSHYAGKFRTVELNAPFYSWPTTSTVKSWLRQVGTRKFVYTVKVSELITHVKRFKGTKTLIKDFGLIADLLGPRMGCFLFQLPPSFHYNPTALDRILSQLEPTRRNVVEFRHASWWNKTVYKAFQDSGTIFCSCSGPRLPDKLIKTADDVYLRFHGTKRWYRHDCTKEELAIWADRICDSGARTVWAYFNNDRDQYAIKNARQLSKLL